MRYQFIRCAVGGITGALCGTLGAGLDEDQYETAIEELSGLATALRPNSVRAERDPRPGGA